MTELLRERQAKQVSRGKKTAAQGGEQPIAAHRALQASRKELNKLVSAYAQKRGTPHATVHMDLRRQCGGPSLETATQEQVTQRIETIRRWFVGRR